MTTDPDVLRDIADLWEDITDAQIAAKTTALNDKIAARLAAWEAAAATLTALEEEIAAESELLATANTGITTAQSTADAQASTITDLNAEIVRLQDLIAEGGPPATAEDIAERDEVNALLIDLSITVP